MPLAQPEPVEADGSAPGGWTRQRIAHLFDFGDEWRVALTVRDVTADDNLPYPRLIEATGDVPPQYPQYDDEEVA